MSSTSDPLSDKTPDMEMYSSIPQNALHNINLHFFPRGGQQDEETKAAIAKPVLFNDNFNSVQRKTNREPVEFKKK